MSFRQTKTPLQGFSSFRKVSCLKLSIFVPQRKHKGKGQLATRCPNKASLMKSGTKQNGRPLLLKNRRSKKIDVRFTEEEYALIIRLEQQLGMSKTDLVRIRVLENSSKLLINASEMIRQLDSIGSEMNRTGNNINQLARHANTLNKHHRLSPEIVEENNSLLHQWTDIQLLLEATLRKLIRMMGR
jgi:hypothetical protein